MAGLYVTLALGPAVAEVVRDTGDIGVGLFVLGILPIIGTIVKEGLRTCPGGMEIGVALGVAAA